MPTVKQFVTTLKKEIFDYVDNPEDGATVQDRESISALRMLSQRLKTLPYPHLVIVCDYRHVEHLLGGMFMKSTDLEGRLEMWSDVFLGSDVQPAEVAKRMAAKPAGTYFIFPEHVARRLGFRPALLQVGIHDMDLPYQGRAGEDEIETLKLDGPDAASALKEIQAPQEQEEEEPLVEEAADAQEGVSKPWFFFWVGLSYLAGGATALFIFLNYFR